MSITKIVTHAGTFHADEVSAVAVLLLGMPDILVVRTYTPSDEDFNDPSVVVLDVGRRYEPHLNNYDHHQDAALPATNMLVLRHLNQIVSLFPGEIDNTKTPGRNRVVELLTRNLFQYISDVDTGDVVENRNGKISPPTISGIIRSCNNLPSHGWQHALALMHTTVKSYVAAANAQIATEEKWPTLEKLSWLTSGYVIYESDEYPVGWEELAKKDRINFLVNRNKRGGYQITSRDARKFPIPSHPSQTFLHNSRFCATYPTLEAAVDHLMTEKF